MNQASSGSAPTVGPRGVLAVFGASKALFFAAAGISFCLSIWLWFSGDRERGLFVGSGFPPFSQPVAFC